MLNKFCKLIATVLGIGLSLAAAATADTTQQVAIALDSGTAVPGGTVSLNLSLTVSGAALPAAVQWTMNYPSSVVVSVSVAAGSSLTQAVKSLNCSSTAGGTTCIAYGVNQNVINAGPLATATFNISPNAPNSPTAVQVTSIVVAAATGIAIPSSGQAGTITVSQPSSPKLSGLACVPGSLNSPGASTSGCTATATFVRTDTTTQGNWKGMYGANGYNLINDTVSYPGYATVTPTNQLNYTWDSSTSDGRALQKALSPNDRIAATWYTYDTFTIDLNFTDGAQHQLAVYCVDWNGGGSRMQTLSILNGATSTLLDRQSVTSFQNGEYLVWNVTGHVVLQVTYTGGTNAVISGLFFDTASIGSAPGTATFTLPGVAYVSTQPVAIGMATAVASATPTIDSGSGTWYDLSWANRKTVTIDHTKVSGSSSLANFPVLFSVIDANLKTIANGGSVGKSDGTDILFTAGDGVTKLSHEIERYDSATGELVAWVNIPALSPSVDTGLYLYYGNASATDQQDRVNTWDSNYRIVNHLKDASRPVLDSTRNANNATPSGSGATLVSSGKMGSAYSFDGIAGLLTIASDPSWNGNFSNYTVQLWVKFNSSPPGYSAALAAGGWNGPLNFWFDGNGSITFRMDTTGICQTAGSLTPDSTTFHQLVLSYNGAQLIAYIDGVAATSSPASCSGTNSLGGNSISLGGFNPGNKLPSIIDEFRISTTTRSADWILTEYRNQNSPLTFYAIGPQE
jgi:hypothetical protein